jgi:hypothetical protein
MTEMDVGWSGIGSQRDVPFLRSLCRNYRVPSPFDSLCSLRAGSSGFVSFHFLFPGTAVPGFRMPPLRG